MRNGRNSRISTPPAKFARLPCKARPIARPAAPIAATNEVVSTPIIDATLTISRIFRMMLARLLMKPCNARSALRKASNAPTLVVNRLISHQPMVSVTRASSTRLPYSMIIGIHAWDALTKWSTSVFKSINCSLPVAKKTQASDARKHSRFPKGSRTSEAARSIAEVVELQRHAKFVGAQHGHGFLQIIAFLASDTDLLALNGSLNLELGFFDMRDDFLRQLFIDTFLELGVLFHQLAGRERVFDFKAFDVDFALDQAQLEDFDHCFKLELRLGGQTDCQVF